jgi:hypothetical protein
MFCVTCDMSIKNYIHKLQQKPVHQRERIAVVATMVGFFIFAGIWILSLKEMSRPGETPMDESSASLNDLKNNFQTGKDSIQDMMQQSPTSPAGEPSNSVPTGLPVPSADSIQNMDNGDGISNPVENDNQNENIVPQLP